MNKTISSFSVVIPVHNEQQIVQEQVQNMLTALRELGLPFEMLLVENGSTDQTLALCQELAAQEPECTVRQLDVGNYGLALKQGILDARNDIVVIFNIEFWSAEFVQIALTALRTRDFVVGSKAAPGAHDQRPWLRHTITRSYNQMLRWVWGFDGTDTHGMKAFWRFSVAPLVRECRTDAFIFDTELVLRAQRAGLSKIEIPTDVIELRAPSYSSLSKRVPAVLRNLYLLWTTLPAPHSVKEIQNEI